MLLNADSKSVGLGWDPRFCISNKLPQDAAAAGPWITLEGDTEKHMRSRAKATTEKLVSTDDTEREEMVQTPTW